MSYQPFDTHLKPARARLPDGTCDCHFHIFDSLATYPLDTSSTYTPTPATQQDYQALCLAYGIDRAVLVHPSVYGPDHSSYEHLLTKNQDWMRGVAVAYPETTDLQLERWNQLGTKGTRINVLFQAGPPRAHIDTIIDKVKPYGWHIQLFGDLIDTPDLASHIVDRGLPVVIDHIGHGAPDQLITSPGFLNLLALMREGQAWVKLSAPYRLSTQGPHYPEVHQLVDALVNANPARVLWGTDWPHPRITGSMPNDGNLVDLVFDWLPDAAIQQAVLVDNPTQLYWTD